MAVLDLPLLKAQFSFLRALLILSNIQGGPLLAPLGGGWLQLQEQWVPEGQQKPMSETSLSAGWVPEWPLLTC